MQIYQVGKTGVLLATEARACVAYVIVADGSNNCIRKVAPGFVGVLANFGVDLGDIVASIDSLDETVDGSGAGTLGAGGASAENGLGFVDAGDGFPSVALGRADAAGEVTFFFCSDSKHGNLRAGRCERGRSQVWQPTCQVCARSVERVTNCTLFEHCLGKQFCGFEFLFDFRTDT